MQMDFFAAEEVRILKEKEQELLHEVDALKAKLFIRQQDAVLTEEAKQRESLGLNPLLDIDGSYQPLLARSYAASLHRAGKYQYNASHSHSHSHSHSRIPVPRGSRTTLAKAKGGATKTAAPAASGAEGGDAAQQQQQAEGKEEEEEDVITVNRAEYESLVCDHSAQERLLDKFQRENERLTQCVQGQATEQQLRSAVYFSEREDLNKELNRLKNASRAAGAGAGAGASSSSSSSSVSPLGGGVGGGANGGGGGGGVGREYSHAHSHLGHESAKRFDDLPLPTSRKTAEALRMELNMDATIRALKEQLAEAEAGMNDKARELQMTIEKLRKENRDLVAALAAANAERVVPQDSDYLQLQMENNAYADRVEAMQQKLDWYAQNQQLLDQAGEETRAFKFVVNGLRRELVQRNVEGKIVDRMITMLKREALENMEYLGEHGGGGGGGGGEEGSQGAAPMDKSMHSTATAGASGRSGHRSFADIKKIKYVGCRIFPCLSLDLCVTFCFVFFTCFC
jgi:hypothetical protein